LSDSIVDWLAYLDESRTALPDKKNPRPHQQKAIDDVIEGFATNDRGRLIMACGTGKTLVGVWVAERLKSARTLVLVPSLSLVNQISREWQANSKDSFRALFVCSDQTVADDNFVSSTGELGHAVTTDPGDIQRFLSSDAASVVFSTYQSSPQIAAAQASGAPEFDLVIADEAHHCAGKVDSTFATVLDADSLKATRRLFMTATPRYLSRRLKSAAEQSDILVSSMDDIEVFGPVMHNLTFGQAINQNLLSDYQVVILGITDTEIEELTHNGRFVQLFGSDYRTDAESLACLVGMIKAVREYDLQFVVTFHNRVKQARDFVTSLKDLNEIMPRQETLENLWSNHVSGNMASRERSQILQQFKTGKGRVNLLSNARCLGEGVDVPGIDGIGFIDPRKSSIDIAQAVGRAIRKSEEEKTGTIVLPVFLDQNSNLAADEQLETSRFDAVWNVLNALRAHDEVLAEELDNLRYQIGRHGKLVGDIPGKIVIDFPETVGMGFVNAIETKIVSTTTASWEFWYGLLNRFLAREGHANPIYSDQEEGYALGTWVQTQRTRKSSLTEDRMSKLDGLEGWVWDARDLQWETGFSALQKFIAREGHARPPNTHREDGYNLGGWVAELRKNISRISAAQVCRLESLPGWAWSIKQAEWEERFSALQQFVSRVGHASPPAAHIEDGYNLGRWVQQLRQDASKMSAERVSRLEKLPGWVWSINEAHWEEMFSALEQFVAREGHARPVYNHKEGEYPIGSWVGSIRRSRQDIVPERKSQLEGLPGWVWNVNESKWEDGFSALEQFVAREGHARPPSTHREDGYNLGKWVFELRRRSDRLSKNQKARLEKLTGWAWSSKAG
jgi:superfamily II DNA or RNA helicase